MEPRVTVAGNAGITVNHRITQSGVHVAEFTVASTRRIHKDGQWQDGATTWLNVKCLGRLAENVVASIAKGDPVIVHGRLEVDTWKPAEGETRTKTWLVADVVGHDLSRGTAAFRRPARQFGPSYDDAPPEPSADDRPDDDPAGPYPAGVLRPTG